MFVPLVFRKKTGEQCNPSIGEATNYTDAVLFAIIALTKAIANVFHPIYSTWSEI